MTDNSIPDSLGALRKQAFTLHDFNDVHELLSILQGPFNPRLTKFLKLSDYQIGCSEQHHNTHLQFSSLWDLSQSNEESYSSEAVWNMQYGEGSLLMPRIILEENS